MRSSLAPVPLLAAGILAVSPAAHAVSEPRLVADLGTYLPPWAGSNPHGMARVGNQVVFAAQVDDWADRLFVTDGTGQGTRELSAVCPTETPGTLQLLYAGAERVYYYSSCDGDSNAIWASDGTSGGTALVRTTWRSDDEGFEDSGRPIRGLGRWTESRGSTYFLWGGDFGPPELWSTDGTAAGTRRVWMAPDGPASIQASITATLDGTLLFATESYPYSWNSTAGEIGLWRSTGSAGGTARLATLATDSHFVAQAVVQATSWGLLAWFASSGPEVSEIWTFDGTPAGTERLVELRDPETTGDAYDGFLEHAAAVYFVASSDGQRSLWRSDGTIAATHRIVDLDDPSLSTLSFQVAGEQLLAPRCTYGHGEQCVLWRAPLAGGPFDPLPLTCGPLDCAESGYWYDFQHLGAGVVFRTWNDDHNTLWATDGSSPQAVALAELCDTPGTCSNHCVYPTRVDEELFLKTARGCQEPLREIWVSDGTETGTLRLAADFGGSIWPSLPGEVSRLGGGRWVFGAYGRGPGTELWRAGPLPDSAELLADLRPDRVGLASIRAIGEAGGGILFAASDLFANTLVVRHVPGTSGVETLFSLPPRDGTSRSLHAYDTGEEWLFLEEPYSGIAFYPAAEQVYRYLPATGTLAPLFADPEGDGAGARSPELVGSPHGDLFLGSTDLFPHLALFAWRPGEESARVLLELPAVSVRSGGVHGDRWLLLEDERRLVAIDRVTLAREVLLESDSWYDFDFYPLHDGTIAVIDGYRILDGETLQVWRTDGTGAGTALLTEIPWSEGFHCFPYFETAPVGAQERIFFGLHSPCDGGEHLWTSDGSTARSRELRHDADWHFVVGYSTDFRGARFVPVVENDASLGRWVPSLWRTDGTPEGTVRALHLSEDFLTSEVELDGGAGAIYFPWSDAAHGVELWRTDGTPEGTRLAGDLEPGPYWSFPRDLVRLGDQVIFSATTSAYGTELWQVDGGSAEPELVADLYPGRASSDPELVLATPEALYYLADDGVVGRELWEITNPSAAPCVTDARTLCLEGGRFRVRALYREFAGRTGAAQAVPLTSDSGLFWFFDPGNPELVVKVVDACGLPGFENFWVYSTGLTNVEVELEVVDSWSGERKRVATGLGEPYLPDFDSGAFQVCTSVPLPPHLPEAPEITTVLPLLGGRFEATATWTTAAGDTGSGYAVPLSADSGYFWFFAPETLEILVKMVDACGEPGFENFWLFAGGLTDVQVHLSVRDSWSGQVVLHDNPLGHPFTPLLETGRFRVCDVPQP